MPARVTNEETVRALREALEREGYTLTKVKSEGEQGTDILATKGSEIAAIEVIAYKSSAPARRKDFFEAIFGAYSRLRDHPRPTLIGVAIARNAKVGFQTRVNNIGEGWDRLAIAFPEFCFWFVDVEAGTYERTRWIDYKGT